MRNPRPILKRALLSSELLVAHACQRICKVFLPIPTWPYMALYPFKGSCCTWTPTACKMIAQHLQQSPKTICFYILFGCRYLSCQDPAPRGIWAAWGGPKAEPIGGSWASSRAPKSQIHDIYIYIYIFVFIHLSIYSFLFMYGHMCIYIYMLFVVRYT